MWSAMNRPKCLKDSRWWGVERSTPRMSGALIVMYSAVSAAIGDHDCADEYESCNNGDSNC